MRLRHRLPVRLRHYWRSLAGATVVALALVLIFGQARVRPYVTSELASAETITTNIEGTQDLFADGDHSISVSYNTDEYADMMRTFRQEGEKDYIHADITIDGTEINDVALRLKGNSTLMSLRGQSGSRPAGPGPQGGPPKDFEVPEGAEPPEGIPQGGMPGNAPGAMGGGNSMVSLSEDEPENIPWLISFDEFSSGRAYQGHTEITLRPAAGGSDTAVNEALALQLTALSGQTTQDYTLTDFTVNGTDAVPRLLLDAPDAAWADTLGNGVLYKARAGGSFAYLGDDPTDYEEAFHQINAEGSADLQPVMDLLDFVENSDDDEFARDLEDYLDVDSFARYLATQTLLANGDAMDGPGNNYYLWYDTDQDRFTVLSWDLNLSFSGMGFGGSQDGGRGGGQGNRPVDRPGGDRQGGDVGRGSGALKERFLANADFENLYSGAYADLYTELVASGDAIEALNQVVDAATAAGDEQASTAGENVAAQLKALTAEP